MGLFLFNIDTTLDPVGAGGTGSWPVAVPPCLLIHSIAMKHTAGDCTTYDWSIVGGTDLPLYEFDAAAGVTPDASAMDFINEYASGAQVFVTEGNAGLLGIVLTANGGATGANTWTVAIRGEVMPGHQYDIAIPAP
jgi:hypothetical protein